MLTAAGDSVDKVLGWKAAPTTMSPNPMSRASCWPAARSVLRRSVNKATPSLLERVRMGRHVLDLSRRALHDDARQGCGRDRGRISIS